MSFEEDTSVVVRDSIMKRYYFKNSFLPAFLSRIMYCIKQYNRFLTSTGNSTYQIYNQIFSSSPLQDLLTPLLRTRKHLVIY